MPRPDHIASVSQAAENLLHAVCGLVDALGAAVKEGGAAAAAKGRTIVAAVKAPGQRGPGKGNPKLKAALRAYWARMKGKARKARVAAMLKGRGLRTTRK